MFKLTYRRTDAWMKNLQANAPQLLQKKREQQWCVRDVVHDARHFTLKGVSCLQSCGPRKSCNTTNRMGKKRRVTLNHMFLVLLALWLCFNFRVHVLIASSSIFARNKKNLNVLILYGDDWRHDALSVAGSPVETPFLDRLAKQGIRFTHACVVTSVCWISRVNYKLWIPDNSLRPLLCYLDRWQGSIDFCFVEFFHIVGHLPYWSVSLSAQK